MADFASFAIRASLRIIKPRTRQERASRRRVRSAAALLREDASSSATSRNRTPAESDDQLSSFDAGVSRCGNCQQLSHQVRIANLHDQPGKTGRRRAVGFSVDTSGVVLWPPADVAVANRMHSSRASCNRFFRTSSVWQPSDATSRRRREATLRDHVKMVDRDAKAQPIAIPGSSVFPALPV